MAKPKKPASIVNMLSDPSQPIEHRRHILRLLIADPNPDHDAALDSILNAAANANAESVHSEKATQLAALIQEMQEGPLRSGVLISKSSPNGSPSHHAQVILDDGTLAYTVVPDETLANSLQVGDRVLLEGRGRAILKRAPNALHIGEEARLERLLDEGRIEISLRGHDRSVYLASQSLLDKLHSKEVLPGATLIVNPKQTMAFDALPPLDSLSHFEYLVKAPPPDIIVDRDIGAPPRCIAELTDLIRLEMTQPDLRRRYKLRRSAMKLLTGIPGSGKTLAVNALWSRTYEVMSELTGLPIDQLPPRVFRLSMSHILSKYLGESDRNLDRFFSEVEQLAAEPFVTPDGRTFHLPVIAILEEIDGLARSRGHDPIYDRILTTALQRLDSSRPELKDKLILYIGTTNEAQHVDRAFLRRIGGTVEKFGRLKRKAFMAVLNKHLAGLPVSQDNGHPPDQTERDLLTHLSAWLFSPNGSDQGIVELTYAGSPTPDIRYRRDFLTGALVDRAVQQAADHASQAEHHGVDRPGIRLDHLLQAFDQQVRNIVDQLTEHNVSHYLELPDAVRVATVRRLPQPSLLPLQLQQH